MFKKPKHKNRFFLIINIKDDGVTSAIFDKESANFSDSVEFLEEAVFDGQNLDLGRKNTIQDLKRAVRIISEKAAFSHKKIDACVIIFSSFHRISQTHLVKIKKDKVFEFTKEDFDALLRNEDSEFVKNLKNNSLGRDLKFIEAAVMDVSLNGYAIPDQNIFGRKVKSIEFHLYISAAEKEIFDLIQNILNENHAPRFNGKSFIAYSDSFVFFAVLRRLHAANQDMFFVNFGSEATEIALIKNNCIEESATFNKGRNFFIRRLAAETGTSLRESRDIFARFEKGDIDEKFGGNLKRALNAAYKDYQAAFFTALNEIGKVHFLPNKLLFFSGNPISGNIFVSALSVLPNSSNLFSNGVKQIYLNETMDKLFGEKINLRYNNLDTFIFFIVAFLKSAEE